MRCNIFIIKLHRIFVIPLASSMTVLFLLLFTSTYELALIFKMLQHRFI